MAKANPAQSQRSDRFTLHGVGDATASDLLTSDAIAFLVDLQDRFGSKIQDRLAARVRRQGEIDAGQLPEFLVETAEIRQSDWQVAEIPEPLRDRRVEITGPTDRKMVINALNSGAKVFMADFEDSLTPTWQNLIDGQRNLRDAADGEMSYRSPEGKTYQLNPDPAILMVRPRGLHLPEQHVRIDGSPMAGALFDFGLYVWHNARRSIERGVGPYFYLPKLESHTEAQIWNEVLAFTEKRLGLSRGTIKVTVLIETLTAAFEMDEILFSLRENIVGLNCGRWDYIFSYIKKLHGRPGYVLPERGQVTMTTHFLRSYSLKLIQTCHRRGAFAMGGMAAQIPIKEDPDANAAALAKVRADKEREAGDGHDGTWVAHPGLIPLAMEVFDATLDGPNQLDVLRDDVDVSAADLLAVPDGTITPEGYRNNVRVALQYLTAWLGGNGCVPINHLMEDAATAEIARAQLWQWMHAADVSLSDGTPITMELFENELTEALNTAVTPGDTAEEAARLLREATLDEAFLDFLTLPAYAAVIARGG